MNRNERLTLFIPIFNEEALLVPNTLRLRAYIETLNRPYEIIIGSNGSTDRSVQMGKGLSLKYPQIRLFHLDEKGVGMAFKEGVKRARYERIITVDMDLSIHLDFIPEASRLLDCFDMVIGSKITGSQKRSWIRRLASAAFIRLAGRLLRIDFHDYSIAAKGYRKSLAARYLPMMDDQTFYVVQMVYWARRDGKKLTEIPVQCADMRESRFNLIHEGVYKFGNLFRLWLNKSGSR